MNSTLKINLEKLLESSKSEIVSDLFDALGCNYSIIDRDGNYIVQNNSAIKDISGGLTNAEEIDKETWEDCKKIMERGKIEKKEERFKDKYVFSIKKPLFDDNKECIGIMVISVDITKQKQAEQAKNDFLANMEHDLRTPFSGISGIADILYNQETDPEKKEWLNLILKSCNQYANVLNTIFNVLCVEHIDVDLKLCDIHKTINDIIQLMASVAKLKNITIFADASLNQIKPIVTDELKVKQILLSLISNAIKFPEKGSVTIKAIENKGTIDISIIDTGIGIPEDKLDYIFEEFTKLSLSNTHGDEFQGVGNGLYISRKFAETLNGKITVKSQLGQGSKFILSLPANNENKVTV